VSIVKLTINGKAVSVDVEGRTPHVCCGSNATGPADPTCRLMSGLLRKRPEGSCEEARAQTGWDVYSRSIDLD
jgi:hypothetical protein